MRDRARGGSLRLNRKAAAYVHKGMRVHIVPGMGRRSERGRRTRAATARIAIVDIEVPSGVALHAALMALHPQNAVDWQLLSAGDPFTNERVDIALTDTAAATEAALACWPDASVVTLTPAFDDGTAAVAALNAGATVCVPGANVDLIAAHIHAVARRRSWST